MIASVLILAAGLAASPAPTPTPAPAADMPNLYRQPARCGALHEQVAERQRAALRGKVNGLQYAVLRQVDGCGLSSPVGYHPDYLAPGRADAPSYRPALDTKDATRR